MLLLVCMREALSAGLGVQEAFLLIGGSKGAEWHGLMLLLVYMREALSAGLGV